MPQPFYRSKIAGSLLIFQIAGFGAVHQPLPAFVAKNDVFVARRAQRSGISTGWREALMFGVPSRDRPNTHIA